MMHVTPKKMRHVCIITISVLAVIMIVTTMSSSIRVKLCSDLVGNHGFKNNQTTSSEHAKQLVSKKQQDDIRMLNFSNNSDDHILQMLVNFKYRDELGTILEKLRFTVGAELGVQQGFFAETTLKQWKSAKTYVLVDLWAHQANYADSANVNNEIQNKNYDMTKRRMAPFMANGMKVLICRNFTHTCVKNYPDQYFDYIYVDARHDFKGVYMDLVDWWPKLKTNGIFAGHDYVTQNEGPQQTGQDWTKNFDGSIDTTGTVVKGAVNKFAAEHNVYVHAGQGGFPSWAIVKQRL
jgi:hypothetical protein